MVFPVRVAWSNPAARDMMVFPVPVPDSITKWRPSSRAVTMSWMISNWHPRGLYGRKGASGVSSMTGASLFGVLSSAKSSTAWLLSTSLSNVMPQDLHLLSAGDTRAWHFGQNIPIMSDPRTNR